MYWIVFNRILPKINPPEYKFSDPDMLMLFWQVSSGVSWQMYHFRNISRRGKCQLTYISNDIHVVKIKSIYKMIWLRKLQEAGRWWRFLIELAENTQKSITITRKNHNQIWNAEFCTEILCGGCVVSYCSIRNRKQVPRSENIIFKKF